MTTKITNDNIVSVAASKLTGAMPALDGSALTSITGTAEDAYSLAILNRFEIAKNHDLAAGTAGQGVFDEFSADTLATKTNATYDATNDLYSSSNLVGSDALFPYTGSDTAYTVPGGIYSITFKGWGAGGGGGGGGVGGGGGYAEQIFSVTPGESLTLKIGGGGISEFSSGSKKGGGGGWTSIERGSTCLAGAGAGGGGSVTSGEHGGHGGGTTGGAAAPAVGPTIAQGGTQVAGGAGGYPGGAGSYKQGGNADTVADGGAGGTVTQAPGGFNGGGFGGGDNATWTAGGGGGGYYGGGAGGDGNVAQGKSNGGGAGGSGYAPSGTNTSGQDQTVANAGSSLYSAGTGNGGAVQTNGQNGYAVLSLPGVANNMDIESNSSTITADPTDLRFDFIITENDALTLGTDITVKGSRDGGTTFTAATLTKVGTLPTGESHIKADVVVSGQPSGTAMRYKLETFNEKSISVKFVYQLPVYA